MNKFSFNKEAYLKRINFTGNIAVNLECLTALHHAQHHSIPFENFDISTGKGIHLEPTALVQKMVFHKRGGYCFELNGLLLMALQSFGFEARALLGRVYLEGGVTGRGHQITLVTLAGEKWIVDAGFGSETPSEPIPLVLDTPIKFKNQTVRLVEEERYGIVLQSKSKNEWNNLYSFDLTHVFQGDIVYGNHYTSTHPQSFFVFGRVAALPIENGMVTLRNFNFKKVVNGAEEKVELLDDSTYLEVLEQEFGIVLDASYDDLKPI
tara:strand:- start:4940 stop:5734 length:795 start_codon:yes stop_codon:yes gene_type:complete